MTDRTPKQIEANQIDMELHRLIGRIERLAEDETGPRRMQLFDAAWNAQRARLPMRILMHEQDRRATT